MNTHSLTFPTLLPGVTPRPATVRPDSRGVRIPALLKDLRARFPARDLDARPERRMVKRMVKTAQRGQRIVLGTPATPYEPLLLNGATLAVLQPFEDLEILITTRSAEICEELNLLSELDVRHAITVDMLIASSDPSSPDLQEQLLSVAALAAEGITTRLVLTELPELANGLPSRSVAAKLRRLFENALDCFVFDVTVSSTVKTEASIGWNALVQRLRLEYGFPCRLPGRG